MLNFVTTIISSGFIYFINNQTYAGLSGARAPMRLIMQQKLQTAARTRNYTEDTFFSVFNN
jgi:predicted component of type VI protein secretion system